MRIRVVDRRPLVAGAIAALLQSSAQLSQASVDTGHSVASMGVSEGDVVVVVADGVSLPRLPKATEELKAMGVRTVILVDGDRAAAAVRCLSLPANAVASWGGAPEHLVEAVTAALEGERYVDPALRHLEVPADLRSVPDLSPQEIRVLVLYAGGMKLDTVARRVGVSPTTAREYIERVKRKYAALGRALHTKHDLRTIIEEDGWSVQEPPAG